MACAPDDGFVFVAGSLPAGTATSFSAWMDRERFPTAAQVLSSSSLARHSAGTDTGAAVDEVSLEVPRAAFLRDLRRGFAGKARLASDVDAVVPGLGTPQDSTAVEGDALWSFLMATDDAWTRIERQHAIDVPRMALTVDGVRCRDPPAAMAAIRRVCSDAAVAAASGAAVAALPRSAAQPNAVGWTPWLLSFLAPSQAAGTATPAPGAPVAPPSTTAHAEFLARLVALLSQQSVLALPFELVLAQFTEADPPPHAAEKADADGGGAAAIGRATATANPPAAASRAADSERLVVGDSPGDGSMEVDVSAALRVTVRKHLRVFRMDDDCGAVTLFRVHVTLSVSVLPAPGAGCDDSVQVSWRAVPPADEESALRSQRPAGGCSSSGTPALGAGAAACAQESGDVRVEPSRAATVNCSPIAAHQQSRGCACLGASAGFHKASCPVNTHFA